MKRKQKRKIQLRLLKFNENTKIKDQQRSYTNLTETMQIINQL
jgi:hypothetical protein